MSALRVFLFQNLRVLAGDGQPVDLGSPTTRSLFAYLLMHRDQPSDRRRLAFLFWPRATESAARRNLRQYLHRLRRALDAGGVGGDLIASDGNTVQISPDARVWLDVEAFRHGVRPGASVDELRAAVLLYSGELLEDLYEDWCREERGVLHQAYLNALERLTRTMRMAGHPGEAIPFAEQWVALDPYNEVAHQELMELFAVNGDRSKAIQQYHTLRESLTEDLGAEPLPQTQALLESIQKGDLPEADAGIPLRKPSQNIRSPTPPLVGRQKELAHLQDACRRAAQGEGQFILVTGESGVGKTRLLQEFLTANPQLPSLQGTCHELEARTPYAPLRAAVERSMNLLPDASDPIPSWLTTLAPLIPSLSQRFPYLTPSPPISVEHTYIADAFSSLIVHLLSHQTLAPLHLILDNIHWADSLTWELLVHLSRRVAHMPFVIVGLCRLEDLSSEQRMVIRTLERNQLLVQLPIQRLTREETTELASFLVDGNQTDPFFFQRLYLETEGNPFFIIETIRAIREAGWSLSYLGSQSLHKVPEGIQQVIEARLDRLSPESREFLGAAGVIGRAFTFSFLEAISQKSDETIIGCLEEWVQRGLVREHEGGYDFSHDKIRQVAVYNLSRARQQFHHRRIAQTLELAIPEQDVATLAHHYANSDRPLKALPYLTEAGEQALRVRSYREARQFGLQAVKLLGQLPGPRERSERVDLNLQLSQAYAFTGDLQGAQEILNNTEHLAASLKDERRLGEVFRRSAQIFWLQGQPVVAGDYARRTLRVAEELGDETLLYASLRMLGRVGIALSTFDDAIAYLTRYVNVEHRAQSPPALSIVLGYLGVAYSRVGSVRRGLEAAQRGVKLAEAQGAKQTIAFARMQLAFVHAEHQNWRDCLEILDSIPDPLTEDGSLTPLGFMILSLRGRALGHLERPREASKMILSALEWSEGVEYRVFHYLPRFFLAECLLIAGDTLGARRQAFLALEQAQETGNRWAVANLRRLLAEINIQRPYPKWEQVESYLIDARNTLRQVRARPDLARTYLALRKLYDRAGQIAWAVDCHFRAVTIFEELGMRRELRIAQGKAAGDRRGAVVIPNLQLKGPNVGDDDQD